MKIFIWVFVIGVIVLCVALAPVRAETIKIGLTGVVGNVSDPYNLLDNQIHQGYTITGFYAYDSLTSDSNPLSTAGEYWHNSQLYGMSLTVGSVTFQTDPTNVKFVLGLNNDFQGNDDYGMNSYNNLALGVGVLLNPLSWSLTDNFGVAISTTDLPVTPPDLSKWPFNNLYISGGIGGTAPCYDKPFSINGHVTEVHLIPEPASLCLLAIGGLLLRRKM